MCNLVLTTSWDPVICLGINSQDFFKIYFFLFENNLTKKNWNNLTKRTLMIIHHHLIIWNSEKAQKRMEFFLNRVIFIFCVFYNVPNENEVLRNYFYFYHCCLFLNRFGVLFLMLNEDIQMCSFLIQQLCLLSICCLSSVHPFLAACCIPLLEQT